MSRIDDILASVPLESLLPPEFIVSSKDQWRTKCPIGAHRSRCFSVRKHKDGHKVFTCFACGIRGNVIDLYAALERISVKDALRKMSAKKEIPRLSPDMVMQRAFDSLALSEPGYGVLVCDKCGQKRGINSLLDFAILCSHGSPWDAGRDGSARCPKCRVFN